MGQPYELSATVREKVGKGAARSQRRQGMIPAVIYGGNKPPIAINLSARDVTFKIHGGGFYTTVATIDVGGDKVTVLPRDFQIDPMTERPMHVDFLRVDKGSTVTVDVPVQFINDAQSPGIRRGGALNIVRHRVELIVPVDNIPEKIVADLTGLDINDSLHISKVTLPEGVRADGLPRLHHRDGDRAGRREGRDARRRRCRRRQGRRRRAAEAAGAEGARRAGRWSRGACRGRRQGGRAKAPEAKGKK